MDFITSMLPPDARDEDHDNDVCINNKHDGNDKNDNGDNAHDDEDDDDYNDDDDNDDDYDDDGFSQSYKVYPFSHIGKIHLEAGNKVILPLSALDELMDISVGFPMLFKLENPKNGQTSHCGVLEFSAEEGIAILPEWLIKNMSLQEQSLVNITNVSLDKATYLKLQPHSVEFLDIRNTKDVLEAAFCLGYSCLTVGDTILIMYEGKKFYVDIVDAKPSNAVCIIETDCEVDFAPPLDYKEPVKQDAKESILEDKEDHVTKFVPFSGKARKLKEESSEFEGGDEMDLGVDLKVRELHQDRNRLVFDGVASSCSSRLAKPLGESVQQINSNEQILKVFSGKKYRLMD